MITDLNQIICFADKVKPAFGFPYEFWSAMLRRDRNTLALLADWLDQNGDPLFAEAWRQMYYAGYTPFPKGGYDCYWIRRKMPYFDHWKNEYNQLDEELFYCYNSISYLGTKVNSILYIPEYQGLNRSVGLGWAWTSLAQAIALQLSGFRPTVYTDPHEYNLAREK